MFRLIAQHLFLLGAYALASVFFYVFSESAFYLKNDEFGYLLLAIAGPVIVVSPAALFFIIGILRREVPGPLLVRKYPLVACLACLSLLAQAAPAIRDNYYKAHYGLTEEWRWHGGSEEFIALFIRGKAFCELNAKTRVHFKDTNSDGFADMRLNDQLTLLYSESRDTFEGCPFYGP